MRPVLAALLCLPLHAMALDVNALWDFGKPELSEQRFRSAMRGATPDDQRILKTQIARTLGLRGQLDQARAVLAEIEPDFGASNAEVRVRYFLELGRTYASATHPEALRTPESLAQARLFFTQAHALAVQAGLDALAIDALHMMTVVDTGPDEQFAWNARAIAAMEASTQPEAKRWEGSLRNNQGLALHGKGDYDGALREFRLSRAAHERAGRDRAVRIADWMIAWTYRAMQRLDDALALQLDLERRWAATGEADPYVYEELERLYRAKGDDERAARYAALLAKARAR